MCSLVANRSVNTVVNTLNVNRNVNSCHKPLSALFTGHQLHANHTSRQQKMSEVDEEHLSELIPGHTGHCPLIFHLTNRGRLDDVPVCRLTHTHQHTRACTSVDGKESRQTDKQTNIPRVCTQHEHTQTPVSSLPSAIIFSLQWEANGWLA